MDHISFIIQNIINKIKTVNQVRGLAHSQFFLILLGLRGMWTYLAAWPSLFFKVL